MGSRTAESNQRLEGSLSLIKDLTTASFHDPRALGAGPLTSPEAALRYFAVSQFFVPMSVTGQKLQRNESLAPRLTDEGLEYEAELAAGSAAAASKNPAGLMGVDPVWIITAQHRERGARRPTPLAKYYILGGRIYQAPNMHAVLSAGLKSIHYHTNAALAAVAKCIAYEPFAGYKFHDEQLDSDDGNGTGGGASGGEGPGKGIDKEARMKELKKKKAKKETQRRRKSGSAAATRLAVAAQEGVVDLATSTVARVDGLLEAFYHKFPIAVGAAPVAPLGDLGATPGNGGPPGQPQ